MVRSRKAPNDYLNSQCSAEPLLSGLCQVTRLLEHVALLKSHSLIRWACSPLSESNLYLFARLNTAGLVLFRAEDAEIDYGKG